MSDWVRVAQEWLSRALPVLTIIAIILAVASVGVLVAALVKSLGGNRASLRPSSPADAIAVGSIVGAAILLALVFGVPLGAANVGVPVAVAICLLCRDDDAFWRAFSRSFAALTVGGISIVAAFSVSYERYASDAAFYGVHFLVEYGGPNASPAEPLWWLPAFAVAVLRFGLPLTVLMVLPWMALRPDVPALSRLAFLLCGGAATAAAAQGPLVTLIGMMSAIYGGAPWPYVVLGTVPAVVMLLALGPGSLSGLVGGAQALRRGVESLSALADAASAVTGWRPDPGQQRSIPFMVHVLFAMARRRRATAALAALLLAPSALSLAKAVTDDKHPAERIAVTSIADERDLDAVADGLVAGPGPLAWIHTRDNRVLRVAVASGRTTAVDLEATGLATDGKEFFALVPGSPSRVVSLSDDGRTTVTTLPYSIRGVLAVSATTVYVGRDDGLVLAVDRASGQALTSIRTGRAIERLVARGKELWVLQSPEGLAETVGLPGEAVALRVDSRTLAPVGQQLPMEMFDDLDVATDGTIWAYQAGTVRPYDPRQDLLKQEASPRDMSAGLGGQVYLGQLTQTPFAALPFGAVYNGIRRVNLPYDEVNGVLEVENGDAWFLVTRRETTVVLSRSTSFLVRVERKHLAQEVDG